MATCSYPSLPQTGLGFRTFPDSLARDLVAYWPLDEASGNRYDRVGATHMIQVGGTIGTAAGVERVGPRAAYFPNNGALALTAKPNVWHQTGDHSFTISCWFMTYASYTVMRLIMKNDYPLVGGGDWELVYGWPIVGAMGLGIATTAGQKSVASWGAGMIYAYAWVHIVAWHDARSQSIYLSVNNYSPSSTSFAGATIAPQHQNTITFGRRGGGGSFSYPVNGRLQDVAIWKRVLTPDERSALYNNGAGYRWFAQAIAPVRLQRFWMFPPVIEQILVQPPMAGAFGAMYALAPVSGHSGRPALPESPAAGHSGTSPRPGSPIGGVRSKL